MNIWYFSAYDQPRGKSARTYDFARALVKAGHKVSFFTNSYCHWTHQETLKPHEKWRVEEVDGIRVIWLRTFPYKGNGLRRGINMISNANRSLQAAKAMTDRPDVVLGPSVPLGTGWAASHIAKLNEAAFVFEVRDVWPAALVDDGGLSRSSPVYYAFRHMEKTLYRRANRISAVMPYLYEHVRESGGDPEKVQWIPNGVDFSRFEGFDTYSGRGGDKLTAMYVGGFGVAHDVITIVRAASVLEQRGNHTYQFILIGDGPKRPEVKAEAARLGLKNIEFRDPIPKADIAKTQNSADILIAAVTDSASYRFGLNLNKIFDYFASARPVVFSGNAPNDPIEESKAGYSVNPENPESMAEALHQYSLLTPERQAELGLRGRKYVENFNIQNLALAMEKLLEEAIEENINHATRRTKTEGNRTFRSPA